MIKTEEEAIGALERFSETLRCLEQPREINLFDAVGMATQEVKHSAFFAWLLDPKSPHGCGSSFLSEFVEALYAYPRNGDGEIESNEEILSRGLNLSDLIEFTLATDVTVETEKVIDTPDSRIDIFIYSKEKNTVLVIENKVFTGTHDDQLKRYEEEVDKLNRDGTLKKIFVYLTPFGEKPTNVKGDYQNGWCIIDYGTIIGNLKKRVSRLKNPRLKYLIEDYVNMVDNKILRNNPTIRELCKKIRREHTDALDILINYSDNVDLVYKYISTEWLKENIPDHCNVNSSGRKLMFCTKAVKDFYGKHGLELETGDGFMRFQISIGSTGGPVTMDIWLYKLAAAEWNAADIRIRDLLQPTKRMGEKYCTLRSFKILTIEEREQVFEKDEDLHKIIDDRLKPLLIALRDFEKRLLD